MDLGVVAEDALTWQSRQVVNLWTNITRGWRGGLSTFDICFVYCRSRFCADIINQLYTFANILPVFRSEYFWLSFYILTNPDLNILYLDSALTGRVYLPTSMLAFTAKSLYITRRYLFTSHTWTRHVLIQTYLFIYCLNFYFVLTDSGLFFVLQINFILDDKYV